MRYGPRSKAGHGKKDTGYVSEFSDFIEHFLEEHPEEIEERRKGWSLYWIRKNDKRASNQAGEDSIPDNRYGFDYSTWRAAKKEGGPDDPT